MTPRTVLGLLIVTLAATAPLTLSACRPDERASSLRPLALPDGCTISLDNTLLPPDTVARLRTLAPQLEATTRPITAKPDLVLTVKDPATGTEELLSVWFEERFLFRGEYLEAWQERMASDSAVGYRISSDMESVLRGISSADSQPEQ